MADRDPRTVFVAESARVAEAVIHLLAANDIAAEMAPPAAPESSALTGMNPDGPDEFPVLVSDPKKAADARELLTHAENLAAVRAEAAKRAARTGTVTATCEECGKPSEWPASAMGTTEVCPHCTAYLDVPDPDEDWSGVDFGTAEDENEDDKPN
jgi:rubrerythrin